ncbi:hypothetical protein lerEdw1_007813 [Lerista edwardsae]|nr:hypothetical protein lerEdw1_007813 [Lerista edwardsae]
MEESHQEATEKEVERILGLLQAYYNEDPNTPISFLEFVTDPNSFARTVENMFHVSFLIRDGHARIKLDQDKLPVIERANPVEGENDQDNQARKQVVLSMNYQEWQESFHEQTSVHQFPVEVLQTDWKQANLPVSRIVYLLK